MGAPISGNKGGKATFEGTEIPDVLTVSRSRSADNQAYNSSQTAGETKRVAGNKDSTRTVEYQLDNGVPFAIEVGDKGALETFTSEEVGEGGKFAGPVIVDSIEPSINPSTGEIIRETINFSQDGAPTPFAAN